MTAAGSLFHAVFRESRATNTILFTRRHRYSLKKLVSKIPEFTFTLKRTFQARPEWAAEAQRMIDDVRPFILLNVVFFGFNAVYKPLLQSMLNIFSRRSDGPVVGIYHSLSNIGTIVGSLVSGFVYEVSPKGSFLYAAIAFVFAIIFSIIQRFNDKNTNRIIEK